MSFEKPISKKIGRNDPCFCESGKKYKKCCWLDGIKITSTEIGKHGPPQSIEKYVVDFCKTISNDDPFYMGVESGADDEPLDCFNNVRKYITKSGGDMMLGWQIWEWYGFMIEAEFHAVWKTTDGELKDVTPKPIPFDRVLFLPDASLEYDETQINNKRFALSKDIRVTEYINLCEEEFKIKNLGERAKKYDGLNFSADEIKRLEEIFQRRIEIEHELVQ